jgi:16S rRNA (guanine527-N7)-methyltransferase
VDSVGRKTAAVEAMANSLGLGKRVDVRTERVEVTGQERACRGTFDLAMARAVAKPPVVAEYLVPLLSLQGQALLYRGHWSADDETNLKRALVPLKAKLADCKQINLPADRGLRTLIRIEPLAPCPKSYPRPVGLPSRLPLGTQADDKRS